MLAGLKTAFFPNKASKSRPVGQSSCRLAGGGEPLRRIGIRKRGKEREKARSL